MIFRLWKVVYCLYQQVSWGLKLLDQENAWRIAGCGAAQSWVPGWSYCVFTAHVDVAVSPNRGCNARRLVQQWKANNVVLGHLLRVQICHLSREIAALRCSTLGRDVFVSWHGPFLAPGFGCHSSAALVTSCLSEHRWTDTSGRSSVSLVSAVCNEPVTLNLICQISNFWIFRSLINCWLKLGIGYVQFFPTLPIVETGPFRLDFI